MEHQYIEKNGKQLYSVYHAPEGLTDRGIGVVLCYPLGQEYIRCHRSFVNLGNKLASAGFHVLRFDYYGTGDAAGDFHELDLQHCQADIAAAVEELKDTCDLKRIVLAGVRLGATLAYLSSQKMDVQALVLWSPVWNGNDYMQELSQHYRTWLNGTFTREIGKAAQGCVDSFGYRYPPALVTELSVLSLEEEAGPMIPALMISNKIPSSWTGKKNITRVPEDTSGFWLKKEGDIDKAIVPVKEITIITDWLCRI